MTLTDFPSTQANTRISGFQWNQLLIPIVSPATSNTPSISELFRPVFGIFPPVIVNEHENNPKPQLFFWCLS